MTSEVNCAEAHGVIHSTSGKKGCKDEEKYGHVYLVEKNGSYSLDFYKFPRDDVKAKLKCSHKLELPGHNFIITKHESDSTIFNIFSLREEKPKSFLTIKLGRKNVTSFSESLKEKLKAFSHLISIVNDRKQIVVGFLHVTSRRICITTSDSKNPEFLLEPKEIHQIGVEIKHREDKERETQGFLDSSYNCIELRIYSLQYPNDASSFIIKTSRFRDVYKTLDNMMSKQQITSEIDFSNYSDYAATYIRKPTNFYERHSPKLSNTSSKRQDENGELVMTPSIFDDIQRQSTKTTYDTPPPAYIDIDSLHENKRQQVYGRRSREGARIYSYIDTKITLPSLSSDSSKYEYLKLRDDSTQVRPVEVKELVFEKNKTNTKNNPLNCHVSLFCSKPDFAHTLCLYVIFTASSDFQSFERFKDLEEAAGHIMLQPCRDLTTRSDIQLNWPRVDGFTFSSEMSEFVSYNDLQRLKSGQSWVVVEAHAKYTGEKVQSKEFFAQLQINSADEQSICLKRITASIVFEEKEKKIRTPSSHIIIDDVFPLPYDKQVILCNKLDTIHPLHQDWKMFAHHMGLSKDIIDLIGSRPCNSYTEEVIKLLVTTNPERCTIDYLNDILIDKMKRRDLRSLIISFSEAGASEHNG